MVECPVCGKPFLLKSQRGRPQLYCSRECADVRKYYVALLGALDKPRFTDERAKIFKGDMFALANHIHLYKRTKNK